MTAFANLITRSGLSMSQIARDSGLSLSTISRIASGDRKPSLTTLIHLAGVMKVSETAMINAVLGRPDDGDQKAA